MDCCNSKKCHLHTYLGFQSYLENNYFIQYNYLKRTKVNTEHGFTSTDSVKKGFNLMSSKNSAQNEDLLI